MKKILTALLCGGLIFAAVWETFAGGNAETDLTETDSPPVSDSAPDAGVVSENISGVTAEESDGAETQNRPVEPEVSEESENSVGTIMVGLAKPYNLESLVAESEVIVTGTVTETEGYISPPGHTMRSLNSVKIETAVKGDVKEGDTLVFGELGGKMPRTDYIKANEQMIKGKFSEEEYEKALREAKPGDTVESRMMGLKNPEPGDKYLLFLSYDFVTEGMYYVVGTSFFGRFDYDGESRTYFIKNDAADMETNLTDLKTLAEITPDLSAAQRLADEEDYRKYLEEQANPPEDDGVNWDEITPRVPNPAYGKYDEGPYFDKDDVPD